jgi:Ser-tRNA(Ala) deacylase AlaX
MKATVVHVTTTSVVVDTTPFYVQGGGQPGDVGRITHSGNGAVFLVSNTQKLQDGMVHHVGVIQPPHDLSDFHVGDEVMMEFDPAIRLLHSRVHSAGHLLDVAISRYCGYKTWIPERGFHHPSSPWVEYQLPADFDTKIEKNILISTIQSAVDQASCEFADVATSVRTLPVSEAKNCGIEGIPPFLKDDDMLRLVEIAGNLQPCGGTHVEYVRDIRGVTVRKVVFKSGKARISYSVPE